MNLFIYFIYFSLFYKSLPQLLEGKLSLMARYVYLLIFIDVGGCNRLQSDVFAAFLNHRTDIIIIVAQGWPVAGTFGSTAIGSRCVLVCGH